MASAGWLVRGITAHGLARVLGVEVTGAAQEVATAHGLDRMAAQVAAEGIVATAMLSAHIKGEERLTLQVQSEEPVAAFTGDIDAEGFLRARLSPADVPVSSEGRLSGALMAIKHDAERELYRGVTAVSGERLPDALQRHMRASAQVSSALKAQVLFADDGTIAFAGGIYVEMLPSLGGMDDVGDPSELLDVLPVVDALARLRDGSRLGELGVDVLDQRPLVWRCRCDRERVLGMLRGLGAEELKDMRERDGGAQVTCEFCQTVYRVDGAGLAALEAETS